MRILVTFLEYTSLNNLKTQPPPPLPKGIRPNYYETRFYDMEWPLQRSTLCGLGF